MELNKRFNFKRLRRGKKDKDGRKPLLSTTMVQHTETTDGEQMGKEEVEINGDTVLGILRKTLSADSDSQDLNNAAMMVNAWATLNGVTTDQKEGTYPQVWLCEFLQEIQQSVKSYLPILPVEETLRSEQLVEFLKSAENMMFSEVRRLNPVLKDAGLLGYLIEIYSHQLFTKLNLLLNKDLSVNEVFCLLKWGKHAFLSLDSQDVFRMCDHLLVSEWFKKTKEKLLPLLKKEISQVLQNVLCYEENTENNERSMSEEWFIQVHIDVTQCLYGAIKNAKALDQTLLHKVQKLCIGELYRFVQKYVHEEGKRLHLQPLNTNFIYLCRTANTFMQLRCLAVQIGDLDKIKTDDIVCMLQKLEDHVLSIVQKMMKHLAQIIVNLAYNCVSRVYVDCLMKNKFERLETRWGNVEDRIRQDIQIFNDTFSQLNGNDDQNTLLRRMSEVLFYHDTDALKLTCSVLFQDFPEDSELYLPGLLHWKRTLSKQQVREVLDVGRLGHPNSECDNAHSRMSICCCLCC